MKSLFAYRKTALIISAILFFVFFLHIIGSYLYSGGKFIGISGGSVSVGVVSNRIPDPLNPLTYGNESLDDLMFNMMFRSLVKYNSETGIFEGDLASCDMSDLKHIACELREDAIWSDATPINTSDIQATFTAFSEKAPTKPLRSAFKNAKIVK